MVITAFCFMVLMLVITVPTSVPGQGVGIGPGPVPEHMNFTVTSLVPNPTIPIAGPGSDNLPTMAWLQDHNGV